MTTVQPTKQPASLTDATGRVVLDYVADPIGERPWALEPRVPAAVRLDEAVPVVLRELPGWIVDGNDELVSALIEAGARRRREASVMMYDLVAVPPPADWAAPALAPGLAYGPVGTDPEPMFATWVRAYPPGHPDAPDGRSHTRADFDADFAPLLTGEMLGPLLPASGCVLDAAQPRRAVAACVVNDRPDEGPWISEVFRDPDPRYAGTGAALLRRALWHTAAAGSRAVGLAVTAGNPAQSVYEKLGFRVVSRALNCIIPG